MRQRVSLPALGPEVSAGDASGGTMLGALPGALPDLLLPSRGCCSHESTVQYI